MYRILTAFFLVTFISAGAPAAFAGSDQAVYNKIEKLHGNASEFDRPLRSLVMAMRSGDAETVASLAEFPLTVQANGETYDVLTADDFVENFESLVSSETRRAVGRQQYGDLFVNSDGVMLADGAVWMSAVCEDNACNNSHWAITAINN